MGSDAALEQLTRAHAMLDLIERFEGWDQESIQFYSERIETLTQGVSGGWAVGKRYYEGGMFGEALARWQQEAEQKGRLKLWRWQLLAETGKALGSGAYAALREIL